MLFSNLISTIFTSARSLIVGKAYDEETLGIYDKGNQFPIALMNGFDGAMSVVLYSSFSKMQDNREQLLSYLRKSIRISLTISVPLMFGLAAVAQSTILVLLTEKWIESVPFLMIYCGICVTWPLSAKTHAINAIGESKITFIANTITVVLNVAIMFICIKFGIIVFAIGTLVGNFIGIIISAIIAKIYLKYSYKDQLLDIIPIYALGTIMFAIVYTLECVMPLAPIFHLLILIPIGAVIYILGSYLFKLDGFMYLLTKIKEFLKVDKKEKTSE